REPAERGSGAAGSATAAGPAEPAKPEPGSESERREPAEPGPGRAAPGPEREPRGRRRRAGRAGPAGTTGPGAATAAGARQPATGQRGAAGHATMADAYPRRSGRVAPQQVPLPDSATSVRAVAKPRTGPTGGEREDMVKLCCMRFLTACLLVLAAASGALAQPVPGQALTAFVDRTDISLNDVLTLTIRVDASLGNNRPSFAGLSQDFEQVGGMSTRSTYTNNNGNIQSWTEYNITLRPLRTGELQIPEFRVDGQATSPITIRVSEASSD